MKKIFILMLSFGVLFVARANDVPTIHLMPADIVQESIKQVHWTTNTFAVKWKYTEDGAKRMLDFWMQHSGQKICIAVGTFSTPPFKAPEPLNPLTQSDWKKRWLEIRTDKFINLNEEAAKSIVVAMKGN